MPNTPGSLKFAVLAESGTGDRTQAELAAQMARLRERFAFDFVLLLGGNLHGSERPRDFLNKFETPYKPLLDAGVTFHASLGEDDSREQRFYKLFNMNGRSYYAFSPRPDVRFLALETTSVTPDQVEWLESELQSSTAAWKIAFFHHPLHSSAERSAGSMRLRSMLEPLFVQYDVSVTLAGHLRAYERVKPQQGISHFIVGDQVFLVAEIVGDQMFFAAISRTGEPVDSGVLRRKAQ